MAKSKVYVLGHSTLFNELLCYALENKLQMDCTVADSVEQALSEQSADDEQEKLFLIDFMDDLYENCLSDIESRRSEMGKLITIAIMNLVPGTGIEHDALRRGVQGFFYKQDSLTLMIKGIDTVSMGEIWLSRDILVNIVLNSNIVHIPPGQQRAGLTNREVEILSLVSMGSTNDEIAGKLFISPHTVKTHLYNVFKKISVDNRFQAALWAAKNL